MAGILHKVGEGGGRPVLTGTLIQFLPSLLSSARDLGMWKDVPAEV